MKGRSDHRMRSRGPDRNSNSKNVHVIISGQVQSVFYRKWTIENATKLCLNGWVRNCKDGTVEAVFSGKPSAVDHILDKCKTGPIRARVANVKVIMAVGPPKKGFHQIG
ncbi:uncharacterized protein [Physcomitrium patens]|uniref:acylphosphatase n=1 Tax=Physcomitrium patens TaxID=3218 RepID=A0A2K1L8D1_PHYPA|nr:uncharacterized protein LOC112288866 isoform X2 [Physcomitrium patens]PNR62272.1 hypothetical protein PHYPA_000696 [Physcomitrium patens]|eukprot:XP_024389327.1 uncharacterized protein LOC112288866 isoform X2 [Physcomitrella patens]